MSLDKWIGKANALKVKYPDTDVVVSYTGGIYNVWPVSIFDKHGDADTVVYRTDAVANDDVGAKATISQWAANVFDFSKVV